MQPYVKWILSNSIETPLRALTLQRSVPLQTYLPLSQVSPTVQLKYEEYKQDATQMMQCVTEYHARKTNKQANIYFTLPLTKNN